MCVVSKIVLERGTFSKKPPSKVAFSLDRVDSNLPYVKENVVVMSEFFNQLKNNSTREDLRYLIEVLSSYEKDILNQNGTWSIKNKDFRFLLKHHDIPPNKVSFRVSRHTFSDLKKLMSWWDSYYHNHNTGNTNVG